MTPEFAASVVAISSIVILIVGIVAVLMVTLDKGP